MENKELLTQDDIAGVNSILVWLDDPGQTFTKSLIDRIVYRAKTQGQTLAVSDERLNTYYAPTIDELIASIPEHPLAKNAGSSLSFVSSADQDKVEGAVRWVQENFSSSSIGLSNFCSFY